MSKFQENCTIIRTEQIADSIFRLTLHAPAISAETKAGQFVMVSCGTKTDPLLRRPFSVHNCPDPQHLQLLFRTAGAGTQLLAERQPGKTVNIIGPLGKGFTLPGMECEICLVGGGMGIAPLFLLAHTLLAQEITPLVLLGAAEAAELAQLKEDFQETGCFVHVSTVDGSLGHHGLVTELLPSLSHKMKRIYTCGPSAMMAAVARFCARHAIYCEVSLETHMACGLGACLGCAIPTPGKSDYKHVCKHGPVFPAQEVFWP